MENPPFAENNNGEVRDHDGGRCDGEFQETVEIVTPQEFSQLHVSQLKGHRGSWRRPQIRKVPPQLRLRKEQSEHVYNPMIVSLGPYHRGKPELRLAEEFKYHCLDWCARGDDKRKGFSYNKIVKEIHVIRECYAEATIVEKYDDKALAWMMLLDACIIINFIHNCLYTKGNNCLDWQNCLGAGSITFMVRDMFLLENQIPYHVLKLLISLQYCDEEEAQGFLLRFLSHYTGKHLNQLKIPGENEQPPIHFLEACWRVITKNNKRQPIQPANNPLVSNTRWPKFSMRDEKSRKISYAHRSVMDLKAKGIHVRPNFSPSLMDITFTSHAFYGELQLPGQPVSDISLALFSNLIAYEVSPNSEMINHVVLSYVIFMKSLIQSTEDVRELQEKGILQNRFASLEKVVKLFKEIDTFGLDSQDVFMDVKQKVEEHCSSKAKTWIVDLIHTRFRTPWTAMALFAAVFLLCLTFLQAFFTINPVK